MVEADRSHRKAAVVLAELPAVLVAFGVEEALAVAVGLEMEEQVLVLLGQVGSP